VSLFQGCQAPVVVNSFVLLAKYGNSCLVVHNGNKAVLSSPSWALLVASEISRAGSSRPLSDRDADQWLHRSIIVHNSLRSERTVTSCPK
jgi:hypothetical protein